MLLPELSELNRIRLEDNLTYEKIAALVGLDGSAVYRLLSQKTSKPTDRTLHRIRKYLESRKPAKRRRVA